MNRTMKLSASAAMFAFAAAFAIEAQLLAAFLCLTSGALFLMSAGRKVGK